MSSARSYGLTVVGTSGGQELVVCPWHDDHKPSAWFSPSKELFYCAVCDLGLNSWQLALRLGLDVEELHFGEDEEIADYDLLDDEFDVKQVLGLTGYHDYFRARGIRAEVAGHYGLRWNVQADAAVLPVTTFFGKVIGACYRYRDHLAAGTRYRKFGEMTPVWPMHHLFAKKPGVGFIVCEGAFSAMRLSSYVYQEIGFFLNCVSLLGAKANQKIVDVMAGFECIYLYDNDAAGRAACEKMRRLSPLTPSYVLSVAPDEMSNAELNVLLSRIEKKVKLQHA